MCNADNQNGKSRKKNGRNRNSKSAKYQNQIILEKDTIKKIEKKTKNRIPLKKYEIAQSAGAVEYLHPTSVLYMTLNNLMVKFWGMWGTPLLTSIPGHLCHKVEAPDTGPVNGLNRTILCTYVKLNCFK